MVELLSFALLLAVWAGSGILGTRLIVNMWFSGPLRDLRPEKLDVTYMAMSFIYGPFSLVVAGLFYLVGLGSD